MWAKLLSKVVEEWPHSDDASLLRQLGVLP
jgi:hypothetical protein